MSETILIPKNSLLMDPVSSVLTYVGWAKAGSASSDPVWEISKLTFDVNGNLLSQTWAGASGNYTHKWDDRAGLVYT